MCNNCKRIYRNWLSEYIEIGYQDCNDWITNTEKLLQTESAKQILQDMKKGNSAQWYMKLKKISR